MSKFDEKVGNLDEYQWELYEQLKEYIDENFTHAEMKKLIKYKGKYTVVDSVKDAAHYLIVIYEDNLAYEENVVPVKATKKKASKRR